ncbi:hypothetical protein TDB9533_00276 [Thalassocella blandensis]|nr:hypothetical protein TDB9533_00276 [Thalassocella blandensis]
MAPMKKLTNTLLLILVAGFLISCSSTPQHTDSTIEMPGSEDSTVQGTDESDTSEPRMENQAVVNLLEQGQYHARYGEYALAKSKLERALRIEPRNPFIWYALAQVNYAEDHYAEAKNLAHRALSFAGSRQPLKQKIEEFIRSLP